MTPQRWLFAAAPDATAQGRIESALQDLRVEHAVHRLRTGTASVDTIAAEVGYADGVSLSALLRRRLGRGVRELRRRSD